MKVSVTVIEGASVQISDTSPSLLNHEDNDGGKLNFADVILAHSEGQNVHIERPEEIILKNEQGGALTFRRVPAEERIAKNRISFQMNYAEQEHLDRQEGNYKGSVTTSITYN